jgi:pyruvate kinase
VANAVLDGTDAVMLSGETATGAHPGLVVEAMTRIIAEAEQHYQMSGKRPTPDPESETFLSDVLCLNAPRIAEEVNAKAILGLTVNGYTAFKISSYRPKPDIQTNNTCSTPLLSSGVSKDTSTPSLRPRTKPSRMSIPSSKMKVYSRKEIL